MSQVPHYWTRPFVERFVAALNESPAFRKAAANFSETIIMRCIDTPAGKDCSATYRFDKGECKSWDFEEWDAPSAARTLPFDGHSALARTTAPYALWCKLDRGEMNVAQALLSPDYRVEGPKLRIMWHVGTLNAMSAVASALPKQT